MSFMGELEAKWLRADLAYWQDIAGPIEGLSPAEAAAEFCLHTPRWRGKKYCEQIERLIAMYQHQAERRRVAETVHAQLIHERDPTATRTTPEANSERVVRIARLAEYVFSQHPQAGGLPLKKESLRERAKAEGPVSDLTFEEFNEAFQVVYETKLGRGPKTGWCLREAYAKRLAAVNERRNRA